MIDSNDSRFTTSTKIIFRHKFHFAKTKTGAVAFIGAFIGKTVIDGLVKKYRMNAILVLVLGWIILCSTCMITVVGIIDVVDTVNNGGEIGGFMFDSFCPNAVTLAALDDL